MEHLLDVCHHSEEALNGGRRLGAPGCQNVAKIRVVAQSSNDKFDGGPFAADSGVSEGNHAGPDKPVCREVLIWSVEMHEKCASGLEFERPMVSGGGTSILTVNVAE